MRNVLKLSFAGLLAAALVLACGGSSNKTTTTPPDAGPTMSGTGTTGLMILPQAEAVLTAGPGGAASADLGDMTKFQVDLIEPIKFLISGEAAARLGNSPVTPTNPTHNHADYAVTGIDRTALTAITPGLVVNVIDTNATKKQTTTTSTGVIACDPLGQLPAGNSLTATAPAFIIPDAFADIIGAALAPPQTHVALGTSGYILALVIDRTTGTAVSGATVAPITSHIVTHLNFGPTGATAGSATDYTGLVLITGPATGTSPITISASTATLPACASATATSCLAPASAGLTGNIAFVAPIVQR